MNKGFPLSRQGADSFDESREFEVFRNCHFEASGTDFSEAQKFRYFLV